MAARNERRQPAKLARSCGCLPCRGKHCSLPDFAPLNRGPTLTTPHLHGASGTPPPTTIRRASHYRKRPRRPGGRPPYIPLYHIPWGGPSPATHSRHPVGAGHARRRGRDCRTEGSRSGQDRSLHGTRERRIVGRCGVVSVGPRLSVAKPGSEQCLPLRGKQPHERASFAGWRRSLCAAKRS